MRIAIASLTLLSCALPISVCAQDNSQPATRNPDAEIPHATLQFDKPQKLTIGGSGVAMSASTACMDGSTFVQLWDSENGSPTKLVVYSVDRTGKTIRFDTGKIPGYMSVGSAFKFFVGETSIAALVSAQPEKKSLDDPRPDSVNLAVIYDLKGIFKLAVSLPNDLKVSTVGIYESGNLLWWGPERARNPRGYW